MSATPQQQIRNFDADIRRQNYYWVPDTIDENDRPVTPTDPSWELFSRELQSGSINGLVNWVTRQGLGSKAPTTAYRGPEDAEATFTFDLWRFPVTGEGAPTGPFGYAVRRNADNSPYGTMSFLHIREYETVRPTNTVHHRYYNEVPSGDAPAHPSGSVPDPGTRPTRVVDHGVGYHASSVSIPMSFQGDDGVVITPETEWTGEKARTTQIDQPNDSNLVAMFEDDAEPEHTVTVESAEATQTSEELTVSGGSPATTTASFPSLFTAYTGGGHDSTLLVFEDTSGDGSGTPGQLLTVVPGASDRQAVSLAGDEPFDVPTEADTGVPPLGSGSLGDESTLNRPQTTIDAVVGYEDGDGGTFRVGANVTEASVSIENELDAQPAEGDGLRKTIVPLGQSGSLEASTFGEVEDARQFERVMSNRDLSMKFRLPSGVITIPRVRMTEIGEDEDSVGDGTHTTGPTWSIFEPADGGDLIRFESTA